MFTWLNYSYIFSYCFISVQCPQIFKAWHFNPTFLEWSASDQSFSNSGNCTNRLEWRTFTPVTEWRHYLCMLFVGNRILSHILADSLLVMFGWLIWFENFSWRVWEWCAWNRTLLSLCSCVYNCCICSLAKDNSGHLSAENTAHSCTLCLLHGWQDCECCTRN